MKTDLSVSHFHVALLHTLEEDTHRYLFVARPCRILQALWLVRTVLPDILATLLKW